MLARNQMPDDNAELAAIPIELPHGPAEVTPREKIEPHLRAYLEREGLVPDGELRFLRTAVFERTLYWGSLVLRDGWRASVCRRLHS